MTAAAPLVWVVESHREMMNPTGHVQMYTLLDEGGQRTLLNLGLQPVSFPRAPVQRLEALLANVDGILLGGSDTNVHPHCYGEEPRDPGMLWDHERDALAQALVRLGLARRLPLIAFCRGSHEFNVAMGGSLHQSLHGQPGGLQHWEDADESLEEQYGERHFVTCRTGGALERLAGMHRFPVSSLHSQGVKALGGELVAEAHADDGLVEAFRWHDDSLFAWGFQFHPEWGWRWHPAYGRIMEGFRQACRERFHRRTNTPAAVVS